MVRFGILGPGQIARKFASDIKLTSNAKLVAVASRSIEKAEKFKERVLNLIEYLKQIQNSLN